MKLSIIIPAYNAAKFIQNAVKSIQMQSFNDYEIIIVNDGSTDNTALMCEELQKNDSRIVFIQKENSGVSSTRNVGIKAALGEWITFLDADDEFQPNAFDVFNSNLDDVDIIITDYSREKLNTISLGEKKNVSKELLLKGILRYARYKKRLKKDAAIGMYNNWACWGKFYKKSLLLDDNVYFPVELILSEDLIFCYKAYYYAKKIIAISQVTYYYCLNMNSATSVNFSQKIIKNNPLFLRLLFELKDECSDLKNFKREYNSLVVLKLIELILALRRNSLMPIEEKKEALTNILKNKKIKKSIQGAPYNFIVNGKINSFKYAIILLQLKLHLYNKLL